MFLIDTKNINSIYLYMHMLSEQTCFTLCWKYTAEPLTLQTTLQCHTQNQPGKCDHLQQKRVAKSFVKQHRYWGYFVSTFEGRSWNQPNLCQGMMDAFRAGKTALEDLSTKHTRRSVSKDDNFQGWWTRFKSYSNSINVDMEALDFQGRASFFGRFGYVHWELYGFVLRWFLGPGSFLKPLAKICREKFICGELLSHCQISQKVCQRRKRGCYFC